MITIILSGGLGNQMFQYAAARALSLRLGTGVMFDLYKLQKRSKAVKRNYGLGIFDLKAKYVYSLKNIFFVKSYGYLKKYRFGENILRASKFFHDKRASVYDSGFESLSSGNVLMGYFQNENYFKKYADVIRHDFYFDIRLSADKQSLEQKICFTNSVSIHIRRGDYMNPDSNLQMLSLEYYYKAMEYISTKIKDPYFFIFSDDMEWVKQNFVPKNVSYTYIDPNKEDAAYIDMLLISKCKHNIIANSSFSWWGAWLNNNKNKMVIAPSVWYKNDSGDNYPEGFIPESWFVI